MKRLRTTILATLMLVVGLMSPAQAATAPTIGSWPALSVTYGTSAFAIQPPTSTSSGSWSFTSSNPAVASVVGNILSVNAVGTATLSGVQAATTDSLAGAATTTITVNGAAPTIGAFGPFTQSLQAQTFIITPPASTSAGAWTYTSTNPAVATISGSTVTMTGVGTTTINATQAANWNWATAGATTSLTVTGATPTLGAWADLTLTYGSVGNVTLLPPTSPSMGAWTYAVANAAVATVAGNQLTLTGVGISFMTATQAPLGNYAGSTVTRRLIVQGGPPTVGAWADMRASLQPFGSNAVTITPPVSTSTGAWSFTSSDTSTVTIVGNQASLLKPGVVIVTGVQAAAGNFGPSVPDTMTLTVSAATPPLSAWTSIQKSYGAADFVLAPPSSPSAGSWAFASSDTSVATVSGATVHLMGAGQAVITATQQANWFWGPAQATLTLTVLGVLPTVGAHSAMAIGVGDAFAIPPATSNSAGAWTYTSSDPTVASIAGTTITGLKTGTVTVTALQSPSATYSQSTPISFTVSVTPRATVGSFANIIVAAGAAPQRITVPSSTSNGAWTFTSSAPSVVSVTGITLNFHGAGKAIITALQSATPTLAATTRSFTVTVAGRKPTLGSFRAVVVHDLAKPITIKLPKSNSKGAWHLSLASSSVGSIVSGKLVTAAAGRTVLTLTQTASGAFQSVTIKVPLTVLPKVTVKSAPRTITVTAVGGSVVVRIAGKLAKLGANKVKAGRHSVRVTYGATVVYSKTITVR